MQQKGGREEGEEETRDYEGDGEGEKAVAEGAHALEEGAVKWRPGEEEREQ